MTFLKQTWYAAAFCDEIGNGAMIARTIADAPIVLWRDNGGILRAMADRCPHRLAPLSNGKVEGGSIRCGYHGLAFGADGRCTDNPHGPIVSALQVPIYPVVERHKLAWIWLGEIDAADATDLPNLGFIDETPATAFGKGYMAAAADHQLMVDNILDLSHADYLHATSLGGGALTRSQAKVEERGDNIFVEWFARNEKAIPMLRSLLPSADTLTDSWTDVLWHPNGVMVLGLIMTLAGRPRGEGTGGLNAHIMTPERDGRTHYFYCNTRNFNMDDAEYNELFATGVRFAFEQEDKPMIEAQQRRIGSRNLFECKPVLLPIDAASTKARRIYDRLLASERAADPQGT